MGYDEIIKEIKVGLTGDVEHDKVYLREQMEKYKDHEMAQEIIRACGRMLYEIIPDDVKDEIGKMLKKDMLNIETALDEARFAMYKKDVKRAMEIIEPLVQQADENPMFKDDTVSRYFCFDEFFEEILYAQMNPSEKQIRRAEFPFGEIYFRYGNLLIEAERYEEANVALKKALRWNPVNMFFRTEYMETLKTLNRLDEYYDMTKESLSYAFKQVDIARCLRNLGYYYVEKEQYSEAKACYMLSMAYDRESKTAQGELYYISQVAPDAKEPALDDFFEFAKKEGFSVGANPIVLQTAYGYGMYFKEKGMVSGAKYCFGILYDLTGKEEIKQILDELPNEEK